MIWNQFIDPESHPAYWAHKEIRDEEGHVVAVIHGGHKNSKDNASLIAAAPDCKDGNEKSINAINTVLNSFMLRDYKGPEKETIIQLLNIAQEANRAAIAKARGQS